MLVHDIALTLIPEVGPLRAKRMLECFGSSEAALHASRDELVAKAQFSPTVAAHIAICAQEPTLLASARREVAFLERNKVRAVHLNQSDYPALLKECVDPPILIYVKGDIDFNLGRWISIVGTRKITRYGAEMCDSLVRGISERAADVTIVSGLAYGVDIAVHKAALKYGVRTVCVVADSLGHIYPQAHVPYVKEMIRQGGAIVSEMNSFCKMGKSNFIQRNRIIAGLSSGTVVIESAARGGSLSTARMAADYDREVMAVPGRVVDETSVGCNGLIRSNRASMILSVEDIFDTLGWRQEIREGTSREMQEDTFGEPFQGQRKGIHDQPVFSKSVAGNSGVEWGNGIGEVPGNALEIPVLPEEQLILEVMAPGDTLGIDEVSFRTNLPVFQISSLLFNMEIKGFVRTLPGNRILRN